MALSFDLRRAVHEVLALDARPMARTRDLLGYLMDLLYYGEFRIVEQAGALSGEDQTNLVGMRGPPHEEGGLLLCSSLETPGPFERSLWTETEEDPFNPTERDGLLFALGAAGGKVDLVCKILAVANIEREALRLPVYIAGFLGDDTRVSGAMQLLDSGICRPSWALVGEPTNLEVVTAHRGLLVLQADVEASTPAPAARTGRTYRIEALGESAHSATPHLGRNAIDLAFRSIRRMRRSGGRFSVHRMRGGEAHGRVPSRCELLVHVPDDDFVPSGPHLVIEGIDTPDVLGPSLDNALGIWDRFMAQLHELFRWTTPDAPEFLPATPLYNLGRVETDPSGVLRLWLDYRTLPGERTEAVLRDVEGLARRIGDGGGSIRLEVERNLLPMSGGRDGELVRSARDALREVGVPPVVGSYPGYAEGWIFDAARIETAVFGPGSALGVAHRPNEHVPLIHLERAAAFYERVIRKLCC